MSITLTNISKTFKKEKVLTDISFKIETGEFYSLVGASGSGKSTILNILAGFETADDGEISIDGQRVNELEPRDRNLAMVFQNYALMPNLTVRENILFGLKARKVPTDVQQTKLATALKMVHLEEYQDKKPANLSGGQRQRVAIARAIVSDAKIVLMDEPLSNLDAKLRTEMRIEIRKLQQSLGLTVIYVTHDQTEAMTMSDKIMLLHDGIIQQIGSPIELYQDPANKYVASFFGTPEINFVASEGNKQLAIRPEYVRITTTGNYAAKVNYVELLGDQQIIGLEYEGTVIRAKGFYEQSFVQGEMVKFDFDRTHLMQFNQETGLRELTDTEVMVNAG